MMKTRASLVFTLLLLTAGLKQISPTFAEDCPRPTTMTAPAVGPWFRFVHGPTYTHLEVHFTLHDQFGDQESPLYLYRAADKVWRTSAIPELQPTTCREQYQQLIDFTLRVLNEGERPFAYDNHESIVGYETFLLEQVERFVYLPVVKKD